MPVVADLIDRAGGTCRVSALSDPYVSRQTVSNFRRGRIQNPRAETLRGVAIGIMRGIAKAEGVEIDLAHADFRAVVRAAFAGPPEPKVPKTRIGRLRLTKGWTQRDLGRRSGVSRASISFIELQRSFAADHVQRKIARALRRRVDELFTPLGVAK